MNEYLFVILQALWFMLPSMLAGPGATYFGGGAPLDFGLNFPDGNRILGDGKSWKGLLGGVSGGILVGIFQILIVHYTTTGEEWYFGNGIWGWFTIVLLAFGSIFGDALGSFIKRRAKIERGAKFPVFDQYDYVIGTFILLMIFRWSFFFDHYIEGIAWIGLIVLLVQTPIVHRIVNIIGFKIGWKQVPW